MYTIYYIRTYLKHIVVCIGSIGQTWKNIVLHLPNIIMQRDRDRETFLIHFTLIHRLALPGTTRSLTAMLLCMIAPGLDSSITAVSVRFFSTWSIPHWFAMDTAEFARNPFDNSRFTNCWNFWCQPRWPAARGLLLCHTMLAMLCIRSQPMFACHKDAVCHKS